MITPSERIEAEVWLETAHPNVSLETRRQFFAAVDEYFQRNPTASRGADLLATMQEDNLEFARILESLTT